MGFADGFYYGQGRFIVDTTGLAVDTVVRVKSMIDNTKIWNKTVVTAGTPLIFDVPCKDYYKICLVEDVSDVPTETVAVYKTVDYGQTQWIDIYELYPVIFENGGYADNTEAIDCPWSTYANDASRYSITDNKIQVLYPNGSNCCGKYLTFDLSKYVGKNLYYKFYENSSSIEGTKGFTITNTSKKPVFGSVCYYNSGWKYGYLVGISDELLPTDINGGNNKYQVLELSATSWALRISKIWIAD